MIASAVYVMCAATALACSALLLRAYARHGMRLMLWAGLCFAALGLNNVLLYVDLVLLPTTIDLANARNVVALVGIWLLLYGLVWEDPRQ